MEEEERRRIVQPMRKMNNFYKPLVGKPKEGDHFEDAVVVTD
jgi:hypothetical protein